MSTAVHAELLVACVCLFAFITKSFVPLAYMGRTHGSDRGGRKGPNEDRHLSRYFGTEGPSLEDT